MVPSALPLEAQVGPESWVDGHLRISRLEVCLGIKALGERELQGGSDRFVFESRNGEEGVEVSKVEAQPVLSHRLLRNQENGREDLGANRCWSDVAILKRLIQPAVYDGL